MDRIASIKNIRKKFAIGEISLGSWMQISDPTIAEIMGSANFDWVAIDQEHGHFSNHQLPNIFRSLELGDTLPLVRLRDDSKISCKEALDAGAGGVIVPMIETAEQLNNVKEFSCWPPIGKRGVGFSRANLFGKEFTSYEIESQSPLIVAMVETKKGLDNLDQILSVQGLDAVMIGPYDLSASLGIIAEFDNIKFINAIKLFIQKSKEHNVAYGIHVVEPELEKLKKRINEGYQFLAYSIDSVFLNNSISFDLKST